MKQLIVYGIRIDGKDDYDELYTTKEIAQERADFLKHVEREPSTYVVMQIVVFDNAGI